MLFKKRIDKSLFRDGLNIPVKSQKLLLDHLRMTLKKGEAHSIRICFHEVIYTVTLRNLDLKGLERKSDMIHIRYNYGSPIAVALRSAYKGQQIGNAYLYVYESQNSKYDLVFSDVPFVLIKTIDTLNVGDVLNNSELSSMFQCAPQGGMRRSKKTNTLVIISSFNDVYHDRWEGSTIYYTGMGLVGDQSLSYSQNKTLSESHKNGVVVHLFEILDIKKYTYHGQVVLANSPYQERQVDKNGSIRNVWIFPMKLKSSSEIINYEYISQRENHEAKRARSLSINELSLKAMNTNLIPSKRVTAMERFERNQYVAQYAKIRAGGCCQLCNDVAPFEDSYGEPYLESHHIVWLTNGGEDTLNNVVALCPNCHRKMHVLNLQEDISLLLKKVTIS